MTLEYFSQLLKGNNAIEVKKDLMLFNDYELYDMKTKKSKQYNSLDEVLKDNPEIRKIIDETEEFYLEWGGGRGSSSSNAKMGGGFGNAGETGEAPRTPLHPAELNLNNAKGTSVQHVLDKFINKYGNANKEYAVTVDENGYATQHIKGGKHSVGISGNKGETLIHNHPSGSNFSDADLKNFASTQIKSIVATSSNKDTKGTYQISKGNNFNAKGFIKALSNAKWDTNKHSYNTGADWWLKKNQKKYGYTYTSKGVKGAGKGENGW